MRRICKPSQNSNGFTLVELLIVAAVIIVVLGLLIPSMMETIALVKLRGNMSDMAGLYQNARSLAIRQNKIKQLRYLSVDGRLVVIADDADNNQGFAGKPPQLWLPSPITKVDPPTGSAPFAMDNTNMCSGAFTTTSGGSGISLDTDHDTSFGQTGLPCEYSGGVCLNKAFAYYFNYAGRLGEVKWAALTVSPAGRIKACYWTGSAWTN